MNIDTGELKQIQAGQELMAEALGFRLLPQELQEDAEAVVEEAEAAGEEPIVGLAGDTHLSQWRLDQLRQREKQKRQRRRNKKLARKARRRK